MSVVDTIERKLRDALSPSRLEIVDESHRHAGHVGARPEGETHFRVEIVADAFVGRSRVERHRLVMDALSEELAHPVHALAIAARSPDEDSGGRSTAS